MSVSVDLLDTILRKTQEGKLEWKEFSREAYIAQLDPNSIIIDRSGSEIFLRFANENGQTLETIRTIDAPNVGAVTALRNLYDLARRKALQVDETLLNIKRDLDRL